MGTVKFRESGRGRGKSQAPHDHIRSPVFVHRPGSRLQNADIIITVKDFQEDKTNPNNHWESYYGADTADMAANRKSYKSSSSSSSNSLYNTPYYDYRREQSKGGSGGSAH